MPFFLANPFLWFSLAALIPVFLHLLHRKRPRPIRFAAVRFLRAAIERSRRSRRLTQCAALSMRILIVLLLAFAFAQPLLRFANFLPEGRRVVVIVMDASASMRTLEGGVSRFEIGRSWALDLLQGLREDDLLAVLAPGCEQPRVFFPPVSAHREVIQALSELHCGWGSGDILEMVNDILKRDKGVLHNAEIHLFSDFQQSDYNLSLLEEISANLEKRRGILFCNQVAHGKPSNCGFSEVQFMPPAVIASAPYQVRASVHANENFVDNNVLRLLQDGVEQRQVGVELMPGEVGKATLQGNPDTASTSEVCGYLELEPDSFPADNRFYFSLPRLAGIPALLVGGNGARDTFFLEKAINPGGHASTLVISRRMDWDSFLSLDISEYAFLFLCNPQTLDQTALSKITVFAESGGIAAIFPGENQAVNESVVRSFPGWKELSLRLGTLAAESIRNLVLNDHNEAMGKSVAAKLSPPWSFSLRKRLMLDVPAGRSVAWMFEESVPFALSAALGNGRLWLFSVSANRDWSDWPITPFFFVFMQEFIRTAAAARQSGLITEVGGVIPLSWPGRDKEMLFELATPKGKTHNLVLQRATEQAPFLIDGFTEPGIYQLRGGELQRALAVNIPFREGRLALYGSEEIRNAGGNFPLCFSTNPTELLEHLAEQRQGRPLWPLLLTLAFFLSMLEVLFANFRSRQKQIQVIKK